jgi:hypothetical protein
MGGKTKVISWREGEDWFHSEQPVLFKVFRQTIPVLVYAEGRVGAKPRGLTPAHIAAIDGLRAVPPERRSEWSAVIFDDFRRAVDSGECELESEDTPDHCREAEDVWPLVRWSEVVVPDQGPNGDRFILVHGHPAWRIEHGLQLLLKNEHLLWVGRADEDLFSGSDWSRDYLPRRRR